MLENKKKYSFWIYPEMVEEMKSMMEEADASSQSEFVCQAIKFYMGYLRCSKSHDFISPLLADVIRNEIRSVERNMSEMLFKVAVGLAECEHIAAAVHKIDRKEIDKLHKMCQNDVARTNGVIGFEDAHRFQCSEQYEHDGDL